MYASVLSHVFLFAYSTGDYEAVNGLTRDSEIHLIAYPELS